MIHVVLIAPKIPSNTGNIIRLCANTGAQLHLVEPLGFELEDKKLRRAGLDYHEWADVAVHKDWQTAKQVLQQAHVATIVALTTKLSQSLYGYDFSQKSDGLNHGITQDIAHNIAHNIALIFGSETAGLSDEIRQDIGANNWLRLPMLPNSRSLNLSNSVAIVLYEVWRQQGFIGDTGQSIGYDTLTPYDPK